MIPERKVLLCSSPRSGSTFAANLLRSSPDVWFLNEIMTRGNYLLRQFEVARTDRVQGGLLREAFESEVCDLLKYTLPCGRNVLHRRRWLKFVIFGGLKAASTLTSRFGFRGFQKNPFYRFYYLNGLHEPFFRPFWEVQFPKSPRCGTLLIKEVHLLRSYQAFRAMYPEGKVIYLVRNPYNQIESERKNLRFEEKDDGGDVPDEDSDAVRHVRAEAIDKMVATYGQREVIERHFGKSFEDMFGLFWRLDNDIMFSRMNEEADSSFMALRYEDLVRDPRSAAGGLLKFLGLEESRSLDRYLRVLSEFRGKQKHGRSTFVAKANMRLGSLSDVDQKRSARIGAVIEGSAAASGFGYV